MSCSLRVWGRSSLWSGVLGAVIAGLAGCGGGGGTPVSPGGPNPKENTSVSLILTSTSNAFTSVFDLQFQSLTLTNQAGGKVTVFTGDGTTPLTDFVHLNGTTEPYVTASIPQGVYTAASATVGTAQFTCVVNLPSGLNTSTYSQPNATVTIDMADPITASSSPMGLVMNLQVTPSETYESCVPPGGSSFSIQPTFQMTAAVFGQPNTSNVNGNAASVRGIIGAVGSDGSLTVNSADGPPLTIKTNVSTTYSGITGASALVAGMQADIDTVFGADGTLSATSIEVDDSTTTDLNIFAGPLILVPNAVTIFNQVSQQQYGFLSAGGVVTGADEFNYGNATFQTSPELTNLQTLPFTPSFSAANMIPGQNVSLTSHVPTFLNNGSDIVPVTTVTLKPQTINGTVSSVATSGIFQIYAVKLAADDLFPNLAVQAGQNSPIADPDTVQVYVSNYTLNAQTSTLAAGSLLRFHGLVFNDNGTLRMDCQAILPGVTE